MHRIFTAYDSDKKYTIYILGGIYQRFKENKYNTYIKRYRDCKKGFFTTYNKRYKRYKV